MKCVKSRKKRAQDANLDLLEVLDSLELLILIASLSVPLSSEGGRKNKKKGGREGGKKGRGEEEKKN